MTKSGQLLPRFIGFTLFYLMNRSEIIKVSTSPPLAVGSFLVSLDVSGLEEGFIVNPEQLKSNTSFCLVFDEPILSGLMQSETVQGSHSSQSLLEIKREREKVAGMKVTVIVKKVYQTVQAVKKYLPTFTDFFLVSKFVVSGQTKMSSVNKKECFFRGTKLLNQPFPDGKK